MAYNPKTKACITTALLCLGAAAFGQAAALPAGNPWNALTHDSACATIQETAAPVAWPVIDAVPWTETLSGVSPRSCTDAPYSAALAWMQPVCYTSDAGEDVCPPLTPLYCGRAIEEFDAVFDFRESEPDAAGAGTAPAVPSPFYLTDGDDLYFGSDRDETVDALDGDDCIFTYGGEDVVFGGFGNDWIYLGTGVDEGYGGHGDDRLYQEEDGGGLHGGPGSDRLNGGPGADVLHGGDGDDILWGAAGNDILCGDDSPYSWVSACGGSWGESGNDLMWGGLGNDVLWGGDGDDHMFGGPHDDKMFGYDGNDHAHGSSGYDICDAESIDPLSCP